MVTVQGSHPNDIKGSCVKCRSPIKNMKKFGRKYCGQCKVMMQKLQRRNFEIREKFKVISIQIRDRHADSPYFTESLRK